MQSKTVQMPNSEKTPEDHEMISLEAAFRTATYCTGAQDAILGLVGLISVISTMDAQQTRMPMFGQYVKGQEGHRWSPPPELAQEYWERNIVYDPYRLQLFILGMICGSGGMFLCGFLLILGCRFKRAWLIRIWLYPNYVLVAAHAILMIVAAFYVWWAQYALISAPLLSYRLILVWFVNVYDRTLPQVLKMKWDLKIKDHEVAAHEFSGQVGMTSTGSNNLPGNFLEIPAGEIQTGDGDRSFVLDEEKSAEAGKFDIFESVRDTDWEWATGKMPEPEETKEEKFYSATGSESSDVA